MDLKFIRFRRRIFSLLPFLLKAFGVVGILGLIYLAYFYILPGLQAAEKIFGKGINPVEIITRREINLKETDGRTNILLLGVPGGENEGPMLTDSIIFVSLPRDENVQRSEVRVQKQQNIVLLSIPRDLWTPALNSKINTAYEIGEGKKESGGLVLAKSVVSDMLGVPIHYGLVVDFAGFEKAIDILDGVEIEVENTLDDAKYPIAGHENDECGGDKEYKCRYEHLLIEKGRQLMDGKLALKYARSRYALPPEGSDFARGQRQQKLLSGVKDKAFSTQTLLNAGKIKELMKIFAENLKTDIKSEEIDDFLKLALKIKNQPLKSLFLGVDDLTKNYEGLLINPPAWQYGAWVLTPKEGEENFEKIQEYIKEGLKN